MIIEVTCSELRDAAGKIAQSNEAFREAANALKNATSALSEGWKGSAHDDFVSAMTDRLEWYAQMAELVDTYVKFMQNAANKYEEMDQQGAALIK